MAEQESEVRIRSNTVEHVKNLKISCADGTKSFRESNFPIRTTENNSTSAWEERGKPLDIIVRPQHEHSFVQNHNPNSNAHGSVTESGNESLKCGAKTVSISGSSLSGSNDYKTSPSISNSETDKFQTRSSRKINYYMDANKVANVNQMSGKKSASSKRQDSTADLDRCNNADDSSSSKSSSKNLSEGGYAGSASSNEGSNETTEETKKVNVQDTNAKPFEPSSVSSSELADFSSGNSDTRSGCSTFISCSDFSEDSRHQSNKTSNNNAIASKIANDSTGKKIHGSDRSWNSSSSLRALAPIRKQSSKQSRLLSSHTTPEGKEEKMVDTPNNNYFVSFKKRKKTHQNHGSRNLQSKNMDLVDTNCASSSSLSVALSYITPAALENSTSYDKYCKYSNTKSNRSQVSSVASPQVDRYQLHQANLKRNYLDAFSLHEHEQKHQHLLEMRNYIQPEKASNLIAPSISKSCDTHRNETPIYDIGTDIMVEILFFLTDVETHSFLTMSLSKKWCETYMFPQDLWKILCLSSPFHVKVDTVRNNGYGQERTSRSVCSDSTYSSGYGSSSEHSEDTISSFLLYSDLKANQIFGVYRLLYSSFVKCVRYLDQIKEDALKGRTPRGMKTSCIPDFEGNMQITNYLALLKEKRDNCERDSNNQSSSPIILSKNSALQSPTLGSKSIVEVETKPRKVGKSENSQESPTDKKLKPKFSHSKLTERLLGATKHGNAGPVDLPWSCAIYSVVNWMVAFIDVLGIQIMCLKVLPLLLEDEHQRTIAQRAGLTDIVLKGMILFPDSVELHTAAFHTIVLLARPLGGREGMLFHQTMVGESSGILNMSNASKSNCCKNGIAVMLDSMRRFHSNERLQAMSCWSMVNIALISTQKTMLVRLGGISVAANAMMQHPNSADVQFRALFALINLVIPCSSQNQREVLPPAQSNLREIMSESSEKEILDESVGQITNLVVVAMKNFCSSEAIMNRACLVLHNLSLNDQHHTTLLWTPNCYQMLEWAMGNYRYDQVLQQSAGGTLQRLQRSLRGNHELHTRFSSFIRMQQRNSLDIARREAQLLDTRGRESNE